MSDLKHALRPLHIKRRLWAPLIANDVETGSHGVQT